MNNIFDTIIIGAGPGGLTAGIYTARRQMKTLIITRQIGGQVVWASEIMNYPGYQTIQGIKLIKQMQEQIKALKIEILIDEILKIKKNNNYSFTLVTDKHQSFFTKTIIIAIGLAPKKLNLPGETEFTGKGISYCANCDTPLFKNKIVAVAGGGNAALDAAEISAKIASQVYLIYRGDKLRGFEELAKQIRKQKKIKIFYQTEIKEILGSSKLEKIIIFNKQTNQTAQLTIDGLFIEIGRAPETAWLAKLVKLDENKQIIVDQVGQTSQAGIFAVGDVTQNKFKQIIISCGQGATAALAAYQHLQLQKM